MTTTITFYQIFSEHKDKVLCQLLAKIYNSGYKGIVRFKDSETAESINKILWSFSQKEFIPHGGQSDPMCERQPIYLTTGEENPNNSNLVVNVGKVESSTDSFERVIFIFDGTLKDELEFAQVKYNYFKSADKVVELEYWQQSSIGAWDKVS